MSKLDDFHQMQYDLFPREVKYDLFACPGCGKLYLKVKRVCMYCEECKSCCQCDNQDLSNSENLVIELLDGKRLL